MKQTMIVGKLNEVTRQLGESLGRYCRVQLCAPELLEEMLLRVRSQLVIVSLVGAENAGGEIFSMLAKKPDVPVLALGSQEDKEKLEKDGVLNDRIEMLCRPVGLETVTGRALELLGLSRDEKPLPVVLVVDDDPTFLRAIQGMLSKRYRVTIATSGPGALAAIAKVRPDVILLDYQMPVCDGEMTLQMLREDADTREIPVVFLTGMSDAAHVQKLLSLHPQGYLLKPPDEGKIVSAIEKVLGAKHGKG